MSDQNSGVCPVTELIDKFVKLIVPEDYDEGTRLDMYARVEHFNQTIDKLNRLNAMATNIREKVGPTFKRLKQRIGENILVLDLPEVCLASLARIGSGFYNLQTWALLFVDAFPFSSGGIVEFSGFPSGGYDECLMIESPESDDNLPVIRGQYCPLGLPQILPTSNEYERGEHKLNETSLRSLNQFIADMKAKHSSQNDQNMPQRIKNFYFTTTLITDVFSTSDWTKTIDTKLPVGICLPSTCRAQDVEYALNKVMYPIIQFPIVINSDCDYVGKPLVINNYQWTTISIFCSLIILVIMSTLYELYKTKYPNKSDETILSQISQSFSGISNFKSIFWSIRPNSRFGLLDGIRTILSFWVILGHEHILGFLPFNSKRVEASTSWGFIMSNKYTLIKNINIIDTFFFIGGMMTCYVMLAKLEKSKGKFNYYQYVLYRYLRILPATFGAILLIFIYPLFGSGPFWTQITNILYIPCRDNWMSSVLMTSNIDISFPEKYICNTGNWYISSDFQLHLLAPIVFLVLYHYPKSGVIWNLFLIIVGMFICIAPRLIWKIPHFFEYPRVDSIWTVGNLFITYYWRPDPHIVSYVFGILCGYLIRQKPDLYLGGRIGELFLWIICSTLTFATLYWTNNFYDPYYPLSTQEMLLFLAISKLTYLCGWFWLFYACVTGRGGFVNSFFSWNGFKSTSNLSFEVCILHTMIILYRVGTARDSVVYSAYFVWTVVFFDYVATYLLSIAFYLLVSAPFANLVNILVTSQQNSGNKVIAKDVEQTLK